MAQVILPTSRIAKEFLRLHDKLQRVFGFLLESVWPEDKELRVNSIYRTKVEDEALKASGIHHSFPHRAMDIRTWPLTDAELAKITYTLNDRFHYDPSRPKYPVCYSKNHGDGVHMHLQVCDWTKERNGPPEEDSE